MNNFTKSLLEDYKQAIADNDEGAKQKVWAFAMMDQELTAALLEIDRKQANTNKHTPQ